MKSGWWDETYVWEVGRKMCVEGGVEKFEGWGLKMCGRGIGKFVYGGGIKMGGYSLRLYIMHMMFDLELMHFLSDFYIVKMYLIGLRCHILGFFFCK